MHNKNIIFARFSLFTVYFWFGLLKVLDLSPAEGLVEALFNETLGIFIPFSLFYVSFALFECIIGILFLIKGLEKVVFYVTLVHLLTTALPLYFLPDYTWSGVMSLTLVGQYIVKNLLILSTALFIYSYPEHGKKA